MKIAHGLFTWQDGRAALEACLRSTAGIVDEVIIAEGLIEGVPDLGLPWHSDLTWMVGADYLPARVPISSKEARGVGLAPWGTLSAACNWILGTAARLGCEWLLYVDGDQELHNGGQLRAWLESYEGDAFPIPRQDLVRHPCPWQCVRVPAIRRYVAGCYVVEMTSGELRHLTLDEVPDGDVFKDAPWISHHPERRPPWRRHQRLGQLETILEPPPPALSLLPPPLMVEVSPMGTTETGAPEWYCPGCGARYFGPGICQAGHTPQEIIHDDENFPPSGTVGPEAQAATSGDAAPAAEEPEAAPDPPPAPPATFADTPEDTAPGPTPLEQLKTLLAQAHELAARL